eukprot:3936585-Rhodomonas_salina.1
MMIPGGVHRRRTHKPPPPASRTDSVALSNPHEGDASKRKVSRAHVTSHVGSDSHRQPPPHERAGAGRGVQGSGPGAVALKEEAAEQGGQTEPKSNFRG